MKIISLVILIAALALGFATVEAGAATAKWHSTSKATISFGLPTNGGGKSEITLHKRAMKSRNKRAGKNKKGPITKLSYFNAVNKMKCFFVCRATATQRKEFSIFEHGKLVSRGRVTVISTKNPTGDIFKLKISYLADGYSWIGAGRSVVCENCRHFAFLRGPGVKAKTGGTPGIVVNPPPPVPSPVPLPPAMAMLFTGLFGLFGVRKLKRS